MRNFFRVCLLAGAFPLVACSPAQQAKVTTVVNKVVADGQLFCAKATVQGPVVVALADALGAPVIATGAAAAVVAADCAAIGAIPVAPPASPAVAPVVAVVLPTVPVVAPAPASAPTK